MDVTSAMCAHGHEQVVLVADPPSGLRAVIAVHSTALGPSLGGVRFWTYESDADAIQDVLALSEAMTWKASIAGLHQGGGKAVVVLDDLNAVHDDAMLRALGRAIDDLGGRYLAAEDVGATTADMELLATVTPWVTGIRETLGGSGDPSPVTAFGVLAAMRAGLAAVDGPDATLAGQRVAIQGAGKVGRHLAQLVANAGGHVLIADHREDRAALVAQACGGQLVGVDEVLSVACDVLAPCALGGVLNDTTVPRLECRVVCGAANNQLAGPAADEAIHQRGIVYIPDFVAGAGGIINIAEEFTGYSRARALHRTATIEATTAALLARAGVEGVTTNTIALAMARERVEREGGGRRWEPGAPAAWTHGEPLRQLRPAGTVR